MFKRCSLTELTSLAGHLGLARGGKKECRPWEVGRAGRDGWSLGGGGQTETWLDLSWVPLS